MDLLMAQDGGHGPGMHGPVLIVLAIFLVLSVLAVGAPRAVEYRKRSAKPRERDPQRLIVPAGISATSTSGAEELSGIPAELGVQPGSAVVSVQGLTKHYGDLVAVDDLTFSLEPGTITGFLGPNGAGKTTTLRLLLGLAEPAAGEALVFGRRYRELEQPARQVGAVLESNDFHPGRSGGDHLRSLALAAEIPFRRVDEVLELVELSGSADRRVRTYSLGMRQRLGLAAALLGDPELLILDEPMNGLDPVGMHWLRSFMHGFAERGRTVLEPGPREMSRRSREDPARCCCSRLWSLPWEHRRPKDPASPPIHRLAAPTVPRFRESRIPRQPRPPRRTRSGRHRPNWTHLP
ncbi:hypothetical protein BH23CHL4_BH23CHL4_22390 [soil metagenome]